MKCLALNQASAVAIIPRRWTVATHFFTISVSEKVKLGCLNAINRNNVRRTNGDRRIASCCPGNGVSAARHAAADCAVS